MDELLYRVDDGVATLTLNQPAKLNPLALPLQQQMRHRLAQVRADSALRALVITGAGRAFCVGAELDALQPADGDAASLGAWLEDTMTSLSNPLVEDLRSLPVPTLAVVNGACAGAGVGLALACDVVIAARSAYFYLPFVPKLGIVPDLGSSWFLPRLVGRARSVGMSLLGDRIGAEQAVTWGLIWQCVDDGGLAAATQETAARLAALPPHAAAEVRALHDASETNDLPAQLRLEAQRQHALADGPAFREGVAAFLGKRAPVFQGR